MRYCPIIALAALGCGGGDSSVPDATADATIDVAEEDAPVDVYIDVPPEPVIWVSSATTLYRFDPTSHVVTRVADFACNGIPMVDLAMNAAEELYGVTSESLVRIDKKTAVCTVIAQGDYPYATGFVTTGDAGAEILAGYKYSVYDRMDLDSGAATYAGNLNPNDAGGFYIASGDMVSLAGGPTYLTTQGDPNSGDLLVTVDPQTGTTLQFVGYSNHYALVGLAQWAGVPYAFAAGGGVFSIKLEDAGISLISIYPTYDFGDAGSDDAAIDAEAGSKVPIAWRGAAVTTRAPTQ